MNGYELIRVRAVGDLRVARLTATGAVARQSWAGRDADGAALPGGELVPRHPHYLYAIRTGDLELVAATDD